MNSRTATGLTGLPVCKNPVYVLNTLYGKILRALEKIPKDSAYRKYTEEIIAYRASIVCKASSVCEIEQKLNSGIAEEIIVQAENELHLIRNLTFSKPWEPLITEPPKDQWTWPPAKITYCINRKFYCIFGLFGS